MDNDVKEKIKSDGTFRATVTDQAKESVKTAEQKITNKAEAGSIPQKAKNPDRGTELIEVGQDVEANGALLYSVGRLTKDQTLQKVGQGTHALGQFCQAVGAYQKAQSEASLALAASSGIGLAMVAFSMFQQSSQDDAMAAIFKELQKIEEELYKIENQINELKELTFEGFEGLNLKADYGISLQQQALNNDLRAIYSSIQRDSDTNVKSERDFLSAVNLDFAYCTDPKGRTDLSILTRCFVDFKNLTDRLSTYALTTNSGPEISDRDLFLYQVWALRNFRSSTDAISPFQSKTAANASDLISVFYRGLPKIFGMDGADRPPDMDLWLQATKNYAALSSSLQNLKLSPSELSGYGDAFDNPTVTSGDI